jgi:hypothetical protein
VAREAEATVNRAVQNTLRTRRRRITAAGGALALLALGAAGLSAAAVPAHAAQAGRAATAKTAGFNTPGNIIIADQFNNRVIEVNKHHQVVWHFGNGSSVAGPHSVVGVNDVERVGTLTLISGTGTPAGADPSCTAKGGCPDNRVFLVNRAGAIVWQYGMAGVTGFGADQLNTPVQATYLPTGHVLITDQGNQRVIEVNKLDKIVWQ